MEIAKHMHRVLSSIALKTTHVAYFLSAQTIPQKTNKNLPKCALKTSPRKGLGTYLLSPDRSGNLLRASRQAQGPMERKVR